MLAGFFVASAFLWTTASLVLSGRQIKHVEKHRAAVPADFASVVTPDEHAKAADYTVARERLSRVEAVVDLLLSLAWVGGGISIVYGALAAALPSSLWLGCAFLVTTACVGTLVGLPFSIYKAFVLEQRFGFNRTLRRASYWIASKVGRSRLLSPCRSFSPAYG